jgi:hypothetical protein
MLSIAPGLDVVPKVIGIELVVSSHPHDFPSEMPNGVVVVQTLIRHAGDVTAISKM